MTTAPAPVTASKQPGALKPVAQESEIETLHRQSRQLQATLRQRERTYEDYVMTLNVE